MRTEGCVLDRLVLSSTCNLHSDYESFGYQGFCLLPCVVERVLRHRAGPTCSASGTRSASRARAAARREPKASAGAASARSSPDQRRVSETGAAPHGSRLEFYF